jgi:excisionase family DNA binding protein
MSVYNITKLAQRWECSEQHVRNLIVRGELKAWKLGSKLWRINARDAEEYQCRIASQGLVENTASHGTRATSADVIDLGQTIQKRRPAAPRLATHS